MTIPSFPSLIGLTYPQQYSPTWRTIKQEAISGKEYRLQLWTYPRYKYEVPISYLGTVTGQPGYPANQDWQTFVGFFNSLGGSALPFHWNYPYDNSIANQSLGVGDGVTTAFNFIRTLGGFNDPTQDVTAVSSVKVAGTPTSAYTLLTDQNFGFTYGINFNSAPASSASITASFTYNWPCRFDADNADLENFYFNFFSLKKIAFESMKVI